MGQRLCSSERHRERIDKTKLRTYPETTEKKNAIFPPRLPHQPKQLHQAFRAHNQIHLPHRIFPMRNNPPSRHLRNILEGFLHKKKSTSALHPSHNKQSQNKAGPSQVNLTKKFNPSASESIVIATLNQFLSSWLTMPRCLYTSSTTVSSTTSSAVKTSCPHRPLNSCLACFRESNFLE